nr:protein AHNAK2-like isoform X1 [Globicephala melas]
MCDCFHMMLPTWSEAPGSASGRQLQPEEPDAETAEDQSVTEGSVDEIIRPRPQGSSPVYEYVTEGAGFGLPSTQEATEGTLKTKVEAGASGYIVTGGGDQGIFVKQVLKESSAAKLFSLREGDQLLSTTIFFDDIKYEDALKILQYSEPYKVQFTVRRQLPAREDEEGASGGAPRGSRGRKEQDQDIAEGRTETPTETLQEDGDQERLISKPREGRGRQPQRERLSWPKFQALKSKRGPGPRRSHSSSEASERGDVPDLSPTSTDTEAQLPEAGPGRQRKKSFPNLRFRVGSGKGLSGRGAHGGTVQAEVLVETGPRDSGREASRAAAHGGREDGMAGVPEAAEPPPEPGLPTEGAPGEGAGPAPRPRRKTKEAKDRGETVAQGEAGLGPAPGQSREGAREGTQALELGTARLSLQDSADQGTHQNHQPEFHGRIPTLKTPKFGLYKEKVLEKEGAATALQQGPRQRRVSAEGTEAKGEDAGEAEKHRPRQPPVHPPAQEGGATEKDAAQKRDEDSKGGGPHTDEKEGKMKMLRFKLPSFGWSPAKEAKGDKATQLQETEKEKEISITVETLETDVKGQGGLERDSKFQMPRFKMPSFRVSAPSKSVQAAVEVSVPKAQAEVTLTSVQADVKTSDLRIEQLSAELEVKATEVGVKLPEGHHPEAEPKEAAAGIGLKGHLPKVQMPSIKVPEVDLKAPQVDFKGPKLDRQDTKGEVITPNVEVLLPSVEVDTQAAGTKLESDVSFGDKEVAARDSKFKMPKFKIPSFGVSAPSKSVEAALEESVPNVPAQVTLSSVQADVKTSALSIELPSTELEVKGAKVGVKLPEGHLLRAEPREVALGIALKGHLPKLEKPSIKVPKVDIEGPKLDLRDAKGEVLTKYQVTLPGAAVSPGLPLEAAPCSQNHAYLPSSESSASLPTQERVAASQTDSPAGPVDPMFLASYGRVSFPKFHPPKFGFSVPEAADAEVGAGAGGCAPSLSTTGPARGRDSTAVPRSAWPSAVAAGESPAKDTERGGKDSPLKMPWIKLPSFSWSPEKGAVPPEDPECSLDDAEIGVAVDTGHKGVPPACPVSAVEVAVDALPEKDGEESGVGSPGCAVLEHAPLTGLTPEGGPGLPRGDPAAPRSRPPAGGGAPEGVDVDPHLPQAHAPLLDLARPDLRPSKAKVGGSSSAADPPSPGHSSQGHGLRDGPASQPLGEATAPSVGDPQQPSCSPADVDAPAVESAASQGGWFRMPALRLPSLRRPAKERGAAGARGAPVPAPAASTLREGESPAPVRGQGVPGSEVEEAMSLQPPEAGADEAAAELASHADADVLKRGPGDKRSELHLSPAGAPAAGLSPSEARVRPGEGSLPLQMPSGRLSGTQAPPAGPAGPGLAAGQGRAEEWPSQPEGPIKLKASRTDGPSQVSVVNMGQPWEGSVVTVRLPRLSVPRFAFPDPSSEADVFIPAVTEVQCPGSSLAHALHEGSPGVWGASILRAGAGTPGGQPVALGFSPEASPISEVRVHVQRTQGEGPEVAVHSRATAELADLSGPEAISTQVVRQLEIPASEIQTASYGFSLLKVKMPEPRTRVSVRDSRLRDGLQEASQQAAPGAEPASGGPQPDTAGPSEVISPSVDVPGQPTFTPKVHSGRQGADSCSDRAEGAEVLAFPPKEAGGEAASSPAEEGSAPGQKPGGRRSGLFRFWLPNTGFSSSAEEPRADSKGEARAAAALQTQPGARPEAELPRKPQRAGWLRFPTLGLSSSPTKKSESSEDEAALAEQNAQEQAVTFFDAPESFSPEGEGAGGPAETAGARVMATSTARTGLVLLEQDPEGGMHLHPGPPQSEDRQTDERRPSEAPTVRTRVSTLIHSTESEAEVPESGGAPPSHSPPEVGPQTRRPPRASAAEAAPGRPTRPQPHAGSCAPDGLG